MELKVAGLSHRLKLIWVDPMLIGADCEPHIGSPEGQGSINGGLMELVELAMELELELDEELN